MSSSPDHLLIVDDDREIRTLLSDYLEKNGFRATAVPDGRAMWSALDSARFDLVILDHTYGQSKQANDHMSAGQVIEHFARLRGEGLLAPNARTFATHIAHDANPAHPELVELASQHGYEIAYDGLTVEL